MLGRGDWDGVRAGYERSEQHGNFRVGAGPDGMPEDLGDSKHLRSRVWGIQYGGSSLGAPAGIQRLAGAAPVVGDGPMTRGPDEGRGSQPRRGGRGWGGGGGRCGSGGSQGGRRRRVAYPAGPRGPRLHGPGWRTRAGASSLAGPGRPGKRLSLPGWLGAVRPGWPREGEAAPAGTGAAPEAGPRAGRGRGRE